MNNEERISELRLKSAVLEFEYWQMKVESLKKLQKIEDKTIELLSTNIDAIVDEWKDGLKKLHKMSNK